MQDDRISSFEKAEAGTNRRPKATACIQYTTGKPLASRRMGARLLCSIRSVSAVAELLLRVSFGRMGVRDNEYTVAALKSLLPRKDISRALASFMSRIAFHATGATVTMSAALCWSTRKQLSHPQESGCVGQVRLPNLYALCSEAPCAFAASAACQGPHFKFTAPD